MKNANTLSNIALIILTVVLSPFISSANNNVEAIVPTICSIETVIEDSFDIEESEVDVLKSEEPKTQARVTEIKKLSRHSIAFVVDMPTITHVLTYLSEDLGVQIQDDEQMDDPSWNPSAWSTRNLELRKNENGAYSVNVRFYPLVDPGMSNDDVVEAQKKAQLLKKSAIAQLKSDEVK